MASRPLQLGRSQAAMLAGFLATLAVGAGAVDAWKGAYLTPRNKVGNQLLLHAYRTRPVREDVLLLGSSRFDAGFDPVVVHNQLRRAGRDETVYKMGLQGLRPWLLYQVLRDLVEPRPPRELLVVGLEARYFFPTTERDVSSATGFRYLGNWRDLAALPPWELLPHEREAWARLPFVGVQALWNLDWLGSEDTRRRQQFAHERHGQRLIDREKEDLEEALVALEAKRAGGGRAGAEPVDTSWRGPIFTGLDMAGFARAVELLQRLPCRVLVVRPPVEATFDERRQPEELRLFEELVVPRLRAAGLEYSDLARDPYPVEMSFYRDQGSHLNLGGSYAASRALVLDALVPRLE